jgi:5'-nucleotidase
LTPPDEEAPVNESTDGSLLGIDVTETVPAERSRLLLTNDDGLDSPGLRALARTLAERHEVVVVAPSRDVSGAGTGMGALDAAEPTRLQRRDIDGIEAYGIDGPPGLAVLASALGAFGERPDVVVSGPNAGLNTGTSIIHSGTVGGALTGRTFGSRAVAFSLAPGDRWYWETVTTVAPSIVDWVVAHERAVILNVNVPALAPDAVRGARWATIDEFGHFSVAATGEGGTVLDLSVHDHRSGSDPSSDTALCLDGYVTLTLLTKVAAEPAPDVDAEVITAFRRGARSRTRST